MNGVRAAYRSPLGVASGVLGCIAVALLELWSSQVLTFAPAPVLLVEPAFIAAAIVISLLFALLVPLQVYAIRLSAQAHAGSAIGGLLVGTASMTCCAPVLLPSLLSLVGFTGTQLLEFNSLLHQYWLVLATLSVILLSYSIYSVSQSVDRKCSLAMVR
ncbi:MAG: hypothetical protein ACRDFS_06055 [Chloroflexota bacterium]